MSSGDPLAGPVPELEPVNLVLSVRSRGGAVLVRGSFRCVHKELRNGRAVFVADDDGGRRASVELELTLLELISPSDGQRDTDQGPAPQVEVL